MAQGKSIGEYTAEYEKAFLEDTAALRLERPEKLMRATEHIQEMLNDREAWPEGIYVRERGVDLFPDRECCRIWMRIRRRW